MCIACVTRTRNSGFLFTPLVLSRDPTGHDMLCSTSNRKPIRTWPVQRALSPGKALVSTSTKQRILSLRKAGPSRAASHTSPKLQLGFELAIKNQGGSNLDFIGDLGTANFLRRNVILYSVPVVRLDEWTMVQGLGIRVVARPLVTVIMVQSIMVNVAIAAIANNRFSENERETRVDKLATGTIMERWAYLLLTIGVIAPPSADPSATTSLSHRVSSGLAVRSNLPRFRRFYNFSKFHQRDMALTSTLFSLGPNSSTLQISADERVSHATTITVRWGDRRKHRLLKPTSGFSFFLPGSLYIVNAHIICWNKKFIFQSSRRWWGDGAVLMYI